MYGVARIVSIRITSTELTATHRLAQTVETRCLIRNQRRRTVELCDLALVQHQNLVKPNDRAQSVRNDEQRRVLKLLRNGRRDERVRLVVDRRGRLVHEDERVRGKEGARKADELLLARAEVAALLDDFGLEVVEGVVVDLLALGDGRRVSG